MGVTYKLKDEVVQFIISQRQAYPLSSCRQLAEDVSQKFGLQLSKSSVHDVLKESGIITPRGRKPKNKFEIPLTQAKLLPDPVQDPVSSPVNLLADPVESEPESQAKPALPAKEPVPSSVSQDPRPLLLLMQANIEVSGESENSQEMDKNEAPPTIIDDIVVSAGPEKQDRVISPEYDGAGRIFFKAAMWDLGVYSEENIKETDWEYYLTYSKGIQVHLENNKSFFIDLSLPLERCIREIADGLVSNIKPLIVHQVSDEELFKACMEAQAGTKIHNISIVDEKDHILLELDNIMEFKRNFMLKNRIFVENNERNFLKRAKALFFSQDIENNEFIDNILNLQGFDSTNKSENIVTLLFKDSYDRITLLQQAAEKLNEMYLGDDEGRLVKVKIQGN